MLTANRLFRIRPALPQDQPAALHVVRRTWLSSYGHIFGVPRIEGLFAGTTPCSFGWIQERSGELGSWVAAAGDQVIGSAGLHLRKDGDAELSHLYVLAEHQAEGVGSALLEACCRALRARDFTSLRMWVLKRSPAVRFYQKHNASTIGQDVAVVGDHAEPVLSLRIRLWAKRRPCAPLRASRVED